jgi:flagellar basal-body rod protein FlgB
MKFDLSVQVLSQAMSLRLKKHAAISGNIANADTPGYRPKAVSFEENLQRAVAQGRAEGIQRVDVKVEDVDDGVPRLDGNSVSMDRQMANMTENSTMYQASAEFLKKKLGMMKRVIG